MKNEYDGTREFAAILLLDGIMKMQDSNTWHSNAWFYSDEGITSFKNLCDMLDIDPDKARKAILANKNWVVDTLKNALNNDKEC